MKARTDGDVAAGLASAAKTFEATYEFPYLAHAPMEPLDCVVKLAGDKCEVWAGSQIPTIDQGTVAHVVGLSPEKVEIHTLLAGGSFGRRATPMADVASEAASIAKAISGRAPVKLVWTREDDIRGGRYRPLFVHRFRAGLDAKGQIVAWEHRVVGQSFMKGTAFAGFIKDGIDATSVEGGSTLPYAIANLGVELHSPDVGVPTLWWRSVGSSHTAFSTETFLDELAKAAGRDPFELRRELLSKHPRHRGVLELAAAKAGWGSPLPAGRARGIAVHESFGSFVANVVEVTLRKDGLPKVERVVCAVDCGIAVNPDVVRAQMEGGIGFGLGAALYGRDLPRQGPGGAVELPRLPEPAHRRDAEGRGPHRSIDRSADRGGRAGGSLCGTRGGERDVPADRQARLSAAFRQERGRAYVSPARTGAPCPPP